jgi:hypothetical protein
MVKTPSCCLFCSEDFAIIPDSLMSNGFESGITHALCFFKSEEDLLFPVHIIQIRFSIRPSSHVNSPIVYNQEKQNNCFAFPVLIYFFLFVVYFSTDKDDHIEFIRIGM